LLFQLLRNFLDKGIREFLVITGTTSARKLSTDVALAAQSSATVVCLMGMSKLNEIVAIFQKRPKEKPPLRLFKTEPLRGENRNGNDKLNSKSFLNKIKFSCYYSYWRSGER
jgi:hypothetical protein